MPHVVHTEETSCDHAHFSGISRGFEVICTGLKMSEHPMHEACSQVTRKEQKFSFLLQLEYEIGKYQSVTKSLSRKLCRKLCACVIMVNDLKSTVGNF